MCLSLGLSCMGLYTSWIWLTISFPMLGKFSTISSSNIFSDPLFFSYSSGTPIIQMLVCLILSQRFLRLSSILFSLFSLLCSSAFIYIILSSSSLIYSASVTLLLFPSSVFFIQLLCCSLLIISYLVTLGPFETLLLSFWSMPPFYFWDLRLSLVSLLSILFQEDSLFPLHLFGFVDFYLTPSSTTYFSVFIFCLTYYVYSHLSVGYRVIVPLTFGVCSQ